MRWVSEEDKTDGSETRSDSTRKAVSRRKASGDKDERGQKTGTDYIHERGGDITEHRWSSSGRGRRSQHTATGRDLKQQNRKLLQDKRATERQTKAQTEGRRDATSTRRLNGNWTSISFFVIVFLIWKRRYFTHHVYSVSLLNTHTHTQTNICSDSLFLHSRPRLAALHPFSSGPPVWKNLFISAFPSVFLADFVFSSQTLQWTAKTGRTCISITLSPVHWPLKAPHNTGGRGCCAMCRPDEFGVQYLAQGCVDGGAKESN